MLDRFVDAILYGDERKKKGKGGEELEPKGMFKNNIYLLHTTQHSGIKQTVCLAIIQCPGNHWLAGHNIYMGHWSLDDAWLSIMEGCMDFCCTQLDPSMNRMRNTYEKSTVTWLPWGVVKMNYKGWMDIMYLGQMINSDNLYFNKKIIVIYFKLSYQILSYCSWSITELPWPHSFGLSPGLFNSVQCE